MEADTSCLLVELKLTLYRSGISPLIRIDGINDESKRGLLRRTSDGVDGAAARESSHATSYAGCRKPDNRQPGKFRPRSFPLLVGGLFLILPSGCRLVPEHRAATRRKKGSLLRRFPALMVYLVAT